MKREEKHNHKFETKQTKKVLLTSGSKSGYDIIKQLACKCGETVAYDLERVKIITKE